jgi:predicted unusual protein kinase regulating ubiquinone biosynthesis (AarF/ABC1/UbiB family)
MPDLIKLPSASASSTANGNGSPPVKQFSRPLTPGLSTNGRGEPEAVTIERAVLEKSRNAASPPNPLSVSAADGVGEGETERAHSRAPLQQTPLADDPYLTIAAHPEIDTQLPRTLEEIPRGRSLKMQVRFLRTLGFAAWLFARVLFWYYIMPRVIGQDAVDRGSIKRLTQYAREFRNFAVALGGVMIKLGQFVSARVDVLPEEITNALQDLQDTVPPVPEKQVRATIARELGPVEGRFKWLAEKPIAAASLGQVYRGQLLTGERVVVKVQRPGIRDVVYTDLASLEIVGKIANRFRFIRRRADANNLVSEFGRVLLEEISYRHEAKNAARFEQIFADDPGIYIPEVYRQHSTDSVLTLEDVTSIKIGDYAALEAAGIDRGEVAKRLMNCYLKQIFEDRFFHADPHPGNLFVYPLPDQTHENGSKGKGRPFYLIFVDFGMSGSLTPQLSAGIMNTLTAVITRDARRLVTSYQELGFLLPSADTERIIEATEATFNQVWGMNMSEIKNFGYTDAAELGKEFNDLIYEMPFQVPQDFIYLGRTVGILSGMATSLDTHFNPWSELQPYVQKLIVGGVTKGGAEVAGAVLGLPILQSLFNGNAAQTLLDAGRMVVNRAVVVPQQVENVLAALDRGELSVKVSPTPTYRKLLTKIEVQERRTTRAVLFGATLVSATLLYTAGHTTPGIVGYVFAGLLLLSVLASGE